MAPANQYIRSDFTANAEAESVGDYLNHLHPAVAPLHAMLSSGRIDSVKPIQLMADWPIARGANGAGDAANSFATAKSAGASATLNTVRTPQPIFTRTETFHEGVASSRQAQRVKLYGINDAMDYGIDNALVSVMDKFERALHFEQGTEDLGTAALSRVPRMQGLASIAAWTGFERRHGTNSAIVSVGDGLQRFPKTYWSSFFDAGSTPLNRDMLLDQVIGPAWRLGHQSDGAMVLCGDKPMKMFADMPHQPGRGFINERQIPARDEALVDIITIITTPTYGTIYLVPDRILAIEGAASTIDNTGFALGSGASITATDNFRGTINRTVPWDSTILSVMPAFFQISALDDISYKELQSDGDYAQGMIVGDKTLECAHLFAVIGATRVAS